MAATYTRARIIRDFVDPYPWDEKRDRPVLAVVREVDLRTNGNRITVDFSRSSKLLDVSTEQERKALFIQVGSGSFKFENPGNTKPRPGDPPLSANNQFLCYIIYVLTKKNWQFSHDDGPITIEEKADDAIFEAHHIDASGALKVPPKPGCRAAYVIADADAAYDAAGKYQHRINLHVDFISEDENGDPTIFMPIIIDPDIRHPGGTEP